MSESIINALMHLFAIVAIVNRKEVTQKGKTIVKAYLERYLNEQLTLEYLKLFDNYQDFYKRETTQENREDQQNNQALISFQTTNVCRQISKELRRNERIIVLLQLIEFINEDNVVSQQEKDFINIVARTFNISSEEFKDILAFILGEGIEKINRENMLTIDNRITEWSDSIAWFMTKKKQPHQEEKHLFRENLYGKIVVLFIRSINSYVFKYFGGLNLFMEGHQIIPELLYFFRPGAIINGPNIKSIYYHDVAVRFLSEKPGIIFSGEKIEFKFKRSENGIHEFSFYEESGQLIGIMGGSGVGKTTLLNILNGTQQPNSGQLLINGHNVYRYRHISKGLIGYVPQDDLLFEELTVFQNLYYNARLCFSDSDKNEIIRKVLSILQDLDLEDIKDLQVGNPLKKLISGGQRKRLNIGLELMREPSVLFIDEPTSGLSSSDSEKIVSLLKKQTEMGKLVIANIHQPSSDVFKQFDKIWILDRGGYTIYTGNPIDAIVYFKKTIAQVNAAESECPTCGNVNPNEILRIVETKKIDEFGQPSGERVFSPESWYGKYKEKIETNNVTGKKQEPLPESNFKIPGAYQQFRTFLVRNILAKITNIQYIILNIFEAPLLAFILGYFSKYVKDSEYIFSENKNLAVFLFMSVIVSLFIGITVSAEEIIRDRKILKRESFLNLSWVSYVNSKIFYLFMLSAIQTLLFVIVGNAILEIKGMTLSFWIVLFSTSCFGNMVGLNISSGLNSVVAIYILIPLILVPQILLGGAMISFNDLHKSITNEKVTPVIGDIMTTRWAYEALMVEQFKNNKFEKYFFDQEQINQTASYYTSFWLPNIVSRIDECLRIIEEDREDTNLTGKLEIIKNELEKLPVNFELPPFEQIDSIKKESFTPELAEEINGYLYFIRMHFIDLANQAVTSKENKYQSLVDSLGRDAMLLLKQRYYNNQIADVVTNKNRIEKIAETENELVRKKDPVFMIPESNIGRAHFYAPVKIINNQRVETIWFNIIFIWLTSTILYFALLADMLRKLMNYFENIMLKRK
ncbi:MAG: ATP-binding cassette domain-containing protein [Bacteroidetes bacterium]|nr:ATP-binding cassette domain-containing protein [Bacteroidota bacterium]